VDACWDVPDWAGLLNGFAGFARVILFDRRGLGVSDRPPTVDAMSVEKGMEDMRAVLDTAGFTISAGIGQAGGYVIERAFVEK